MQSIIIKQGQSFFDAVIEATGDISNIFLMAQANDVSITQTHPIGTEFIINGNLKETVTRQFGKRYMPATLSADSSEAGTFLDYLFPQTFAIL